MARGRSIPYWARRRRQEHEAEANDRWFARHGGLVGTVLVDALWSNSTRKPYHVTCRELAPVDVFELAVDPERDTVCGACGEPLKAA